MSLRVFENAHVALYIGRVRTTRPEGSRTCYHIDAGTSVHLMADDAVAVAREILRAEGWSVERLVKHSPKETGEGNV